MPKYGFGTQPAGTTAGGLGTPLGLPLAGAGYERVSDPCDVREIDPVLRDYVVDTTTTGAPHATMAAVAQRVLLALSTPRGQISAAPTFGDRTLTLRKMPTEEDARASTEVALADLVAEGAIEILSIQTERSGGTLTRVVEWRDTSTREVSTTKAGV